MIKSDKIIWKTNVPCSLEIQEATSRQRKLCSICQQKPVRKRLLVKYKELAGYETQNVYCQKCWSDFLRKCEDDFCRIIQEIRRNHIHIHDW